MGTIVERVGKDGSKSFQAKVRKLGVSLSETFDTEGKAKNWVTVTEGNIITGKPVDAHKVRKTTLADIFDEYIKDGKLTPKKLSLINRLKIEIGKLSLEQLNTKALGKYIDIKLTQPILEQKNKKVAHPLYSGGKVMVDGKEEVRINSSATVRHYYYAIRTALYWHSKVNDYNFNSKPFDDNPPPKAWEKPRERRLEEGELERLLTACDKMYVNKQHLKDFINFQIYSCMRAGETILMQWKDIRIDDKEPMGSYIHIPKANQKTKNKRGAADREVALQPALYRLITENLIPRKGSAKSTDRVFHFWTDSTTLGQRFKRVCKNAEVEDFHVHDFRHEGISRLFESTNLTDIEIAKITGHLELDTLSRYAKLRPRKTGAKLWAAFSEDVPKELAKAQ